MTRWPNLSRADIARARALLVELDLLATSQRRAIARLASTDLVELTERQNSVEVELRSLLDAGASGRSDIGAEPASEDDRRELAGRFARVRRTCQVNAAMLAHARRAVSALLGIDVDGGGYDRRARRVTSQRSTASQAV